ncbi:MAG TPA: hypothetical protein VHE81_19660, partial [Lacipirellulaceae bacterium]|nr:hypothetical protein [Lacipirellulaceae bacterium]
FDGCAAHAAMDRYFRKRPLSAQQRSFLPLVQAIERTLKKFGGGRVRSECRLAWNAFGRGRADAVTATDTSNIVLELKVVAQIPSTPRKADVAQLAAYTAMCRHKHRRATSEAVLVYADLGRGVVRFNHFRETSGLCAQLMEALAA